MNFTLSVIKCRLYFCTTIFQTFRYEGKERLMMNYYTTAQYASPEVSARKPYKAEPSEVFSCGVVLVVMLTGEYPWQGASLAQV